MGCAATARPDLFQKLIIIDSPYFAFYKRFLFALAAYLPDKLVRDVHPIIKAALKKPQSWNSKKEAQDYFKRRKLCLQWDPRVLNIFLEECIIERGDGSAELLFPVEDEVHVYLKVAIEIKWLNVRKYFGMHDFEKKADFLYSDDHLIIDPFDVWWVKLFDNQNITYYKYKGSHFWPFDDPQRCAERVTELILQDIH